MNDLEIYKSMYYYELDTKEKINSRITIPIGVATLLTSGAGFFFSKLPKFSDLSWKYIFIEIFIIYLMSLIKMIMDILKVYSGYEYTYIEANVVREFQLDIKKYYDENYEEYFVKLGNSKNSLIEKDFKEKLIERYVEASKSNIKLNEKKLGYLRDIGLTTIICLISGLLIYIIITLNNAT